MRNTYVLFWKMPRDVTQFLSAIEAGDPKAAEELLPLVYEELRRLAAYPDGPWVGSPAQHSVRAGAQKRNGSTTATPK